MAAVAVAIGAAALTVAITATSPAYGYVSEAGVPDAPLPGLYRIGILNVSAALALLAAALRGLVGPLADAVFVALIAAALLAVGSGAVPCTPGCPLPPYEPISPTDLAHAAASIGSVLFVTLAMVLLAAAPAAPEHLRRISRLAGYATVPLLAASGVAILAVGRGYLAGTLERAALVAALGWLGAASVAAAVRPVGQPGGAGRAS
jgi:hypothetical protein